jgi:osmotically inducible lipoprotein OsmB
LKIGIPRTSQIAAVALTGLVVAGCSGMNTQQQRALSGGAIGAAGGAAIGALAGGGALTGALIGGALGTGGGLLYHETQRNK